VTGRDSPGDVPTSLAAAGGALARLHALSDQKPSSIPSLAGLPAVSRWLSVAHVVLPKEPAAAKATEWLMDNAYMVERAAVQIRENLPRSYYMRLPALAIDDASCPPRVYALAHGILHATSLQLTTETVTRFHRDARLVSAAPCAAAHGSFRGPPERGCAVPF